MNSCLSLDGYAYGVDALGLRTNLTRMLGMTTNNVTIGYDAMGELTSWVGKESGGASRAKQSSSGYGYDAANNLHCGGRTMRWCKLLRWIR